MAKLVLIVGAVAASVVAFVTFLMGIGDSDDYGRVRLPGKAVLQLDARDYGIYYEEPIGTNSNETFNPPDGIKVRVRGLGDTPDPEVDYGGFGSQVGTDNRTAETIGTLKVAKEGRYRIVTRIPSNALARASITLGEPGSAALKRGGKRAAYIMGAALVLALLLGALRFGRARAY